MESKKKAQQNKNYYIADARISLREHFTGKIVVILKN